MTAVVGSQAFEVFAPLVHHVDVLRITGIFTSSCVENDPEVRFRRFFRRCLSPAVSREKHFNQEGSRELASPRRRATNWVADVPQTGAHDPYASFFFDVPDIHLVTVSSFKHPLAGGAPLGVN
jgi:hypothetical protein